MRLCALSREVPKEARPLSPVEGSFRDPRHDMFQFL